MADRLLTPVDVAERLSVSRRTVYRLPLPHLLVGGSRRYVEADVDEYIRQRILTPPTPTEPMTRPATVMARIVDIARR